MNQSRLVQSNLWQETTSLWDTPTVHLYAAQHHKQHNAGVRSTVAVRGEICFHFTTSVAEKTIQTLLYFPHYCLLVWISLLSLLLTVMSVFPQYAHSEEFPGDCIPLLSGDCCTTELRRQCPQWYHSNSHIAKSSSVQVKWDLEASTVLNQPYHFCLKKQDLKEMYAP